MSTITTVTAGKAYTETHSLLFNTEVSPGPPLTPPPPDPFRAVNLISHYPLDWPLALHFDNIHENMFSGHRRSLNPVICCLLR